MDVNVLRSLTTLFMFLVFIGIVVWAMAGRRRAEFDARRNCLCRQFDAGGRRAALQGEKK